MASPAKRKEEDWDVEGYLHNVSPAKNSKKNHKYFTAVIQTGRRDFHKVVSFSMEKLSPFSHASKTGAAVKLKNVRRSLSYSDPNGFDVICNRTTSLDVVSVPFSRIAPPSSTRLSVADVKALGPRQNVGELEAKVMSRAALSKIVLVNKEECELKEIWVSDGTGEMKLTLWDSLISEAQISKSYLFSNLSTRELKGEIRLTTTPSSKIKEIPPLNVPDRDDDPVDSASSATLRGVVSGIKIIARHRCPKCHSLQNNIIPKSIMHRCEACKLLQRSSSFKSTYGGVIVLTTDQGDNSCTLSDLSLTTYFDKYGINHSPNDLESIEEHFINRSEFEITVNDVSLVTCIMHPTTDQQNEDWEDDQALIKIDGEIGVAGEGDRVAGAEGGVAGDDGAGVAGAKGGVAGKVAEVGMACSSGRQ